MWVRLGQVLSNGRRVVAEVFAAETPGVNDLTDFAEVTGSDPMPTAGMEYDGAGTYYPPEEALTITAGEFMERLTTAERVSWITKARTVAMLQVHKETIMLATNGINLQSLEMQGILADLVTEQVLTQARAAEVLS